MKILSSVDVEDYRAEIDRIEAAGAGAIGERPTGSRVSLSDVWYAEGSAAA